ncbi:hypothetical protein DH2020_003445 [Rehmannia glutinosa]|uniref:Tetratricopeptide repeat protein 38 n=1 Tax=Rehmannia glutinosa TaxID=99300 RepID=A0ABR0XLL1_REHGL
MEAETEMKLDRWGYEVRTCSDACISAINSYYHQVLSYGRNRSVILEAPESDPECVLGNILAAHFLCSAGSSRASQLINAATSCLERASSYEKAVFEALIYLISPDRDDVLAVELHSKLLQDFPRDLVSLKRAQVLCFYMGRADLSLKLVEQVLPINVHEDYIYGMLAFPLLELGRMEDAETAGKKDTRSTRMILGHSMQYTHNWWHVALCYLEAHAPMEKVRDIYDKCIWKELERSDAMPAEVYLNAVGLLLRVYIRGERDLFEDHLKNIAKCLTDQIIGASDEQLDVFTELHIILLLNTGEADRAILAIEKQLKKREGAPFLWRLLEKGYSMLGREEAMSCGEKARKLEATYFN